ncbi:MAG: hypothetical protein KOO60_13330 [Gemmatimonadales bacterium]|nr:hypothetical protein [Gemmatimonadales bacterium]
MKEFCAGQSASETHSALKTAIGTMDKAKQNAVLWFGEILDRKLYRELESGKLGYTHARELVKVTDENNQDEWLKFALENPRRKLEREVKRAKKEAADQATGQPSLLPVPKQRPVAVVPVRVSMEMSPTQFALYEAMWEQIRKQGCAPADKVEALLEFMASYIEVNSGLRDVEQTREKSFPRGNTGGGNEDSFEERSGTRNFPRKRSPEKSAGPPAQIHIHLCPDCEKATVQTSRGELELSETELNRAQCDCQTSRPGG